MKSLCCIYFLSLVFPAHFFCGESFVGSTTATRTTRKPFSWVRGGGGGTPLFFSGGDGHATEVNRDKEDDDANTRLAKNMIQVSSRIELPFSAEIAFDAFSDLPRQASWSPWLKSVTYVTNNEPSSSSQPQESKWNMRSFLGVSYSWNAITTKLERPHVIEWESCRGLKNWGRVEFLTNDGSTTTTVMQLTLTFVAPRVLARLFRNRDGGLSKIVQRRIVGRTLRRFRQVVQAETNANETAVSSEIKERELVATISHCE